MSAANIQTFLVNEGSGLQSVTDTENCSPSDSDYSYVSQYYNCGSTASAAQIIYSAAHAYQINPQVLLATMEKEQSLVTTPNPTASQINCAMGYVSCGLSGFFNQVDGAAWQLRANFERASGDTYWGLSPATYPCTGTTSLYSTSLVPGNTVTFADPGGTPETVTLDDASTAVLYCYTPYVGPYNVTGYSGTYNFVLYFEEWFGPTTSTADTYVLSFINLTYYAGQTQDLGYPSMGNYAYSTRNNTTGYPSVIPDGTVQVLYAPNGDLSFIRLNHSSGQTQLVTYSAASGFSQMDGYYITGYPDVATDGSVYAQYEPNGDLAFIRLNYYSGQVQVVTYSASSGYRNMDGYYITGYPDVATDGSVVPTFAPNGDLAFVRLNYSGQIQLVTYGPGSSFSQMDGYYITGYPSVPSDGYSRPYGNIVPLFTP
ncbi:MAG TPA: hypothetical protein VMB52_02765 [Verrucomicrobiae bacterium]|nr:hypothetical protein [Verrucomicrobiae bacterium]